MSQNEELLRQLLSELDSAKTAQEVELIQRRLAELDEDEDEFLSEIDRKRAKNDESQEITLPLIKNPERRESCRFDLKLFAMTYFSRTCYRGFAAYQDIMIADFQRSGLENARVAIAVRRGGLKSTLARIATAWGVLYGHKRFPLLVGATDDKSNEHRDNLIDLMRFSPELIEDFPELYPLLLKKRYPKRTILLDGEKLECTTNSDRGLIVFPRLNGFTSSEAHVAPYSMQSSDVSGLSFTNSAGVVVRPDWLIFDDVQTPQSAKSDPMTTKREDAICTTFMGLAGLGERMSAIMVCTVREEDDLSMRFIDRKRHPDWDGKTFPVLIREPDGPKAKRHWSIYGEKLREGEKPEDGFALATAYYVEHQVEMDEGGLVAWEQDKEEGFVSALQWCMTVAILQPDFFRCELQQKGAKPKGDIDQINSGELLKRLSGIPRGHVPQQASYLTSFIDSQDHVLFWMVCAWRTDMTGWIVDFGSWPDQKRQQWYKKDLSHTLDMELPGKSWEEAFVNAHNKLEEFLLERDWPIEGGGKKAIDILLKDWSDGDHKSRIEPQVMASRFRERIRPSKGFDVKPGGKPIHKYGDEKRDRHTKGCWIERRTENPMHVQINTNMAKMITARRLQTVIGAPSALLLPGSDEHDVIMLAEHFTAEKAIDRSLGGMSDVIYVHPQKSRDNDLWDCVVGNVVAASMLGCGLTGEMVVAPPKKSLKFSDLQKQKERIVA